MTINISGTVPAEAQNGMVLLADEWDKDRTPAEVVAVVTIRRQRHTFDDDKQEWRNVMKFTHIEPMLDEQDAATAREMLEAACSQRGGDLPPEPDTELDIPSIGGDDPLDFDDPDDAA